MLRDHGPRIEHSRDSVTHSGRLVTRRPLEAATLLQHASYCLSQYDESLFKFGSANVLDTSTIVDVKPTTVVEKVVKGSMQPEP